MCMDDLQLSRDFTEQNFQNARNLNINLKMESVTLRKNL